MKLGRLPLVLLAAMFSASTQAQSVDKDKLDRVDRTFVCPEDLRSNAARADAIRQFTRDVAEAWPDVTIGQMITFRVAVLERHNCTKALEAIRHHMQEKES